MKKSVLIKIVIAILVIIGAVFGYKYINNKTAPNGTKGDKTITVTIKDQENNKVIVDNEEFKTNAVTLGEFLKENTDRLKVKMDTSQFASFVVGLEGIETKDMKVGPWWMYSYKSPEQNLDYKIGEAPGVDSINIQNGDSVQFVFTKSM